MPLKILKESYPVELVEYVVARSISYLPEFSWWVPFTLKNRDRIIYSVKSIVSKKNNKFGIEVPISIDHAKRLGQDQRYTMKVCHRERDISMFGSFKNL